MASNDDEFEALPQRPGNWEELFAITGGLRDVPIEGIEQGHILWEYEFDPADLRPCGRKGCEQKHAHGWLVAIAGKRYVNIGIDCAKRYANAGLWTASINSYGYRVREAASKKALVQVREEAQRKQYWLDNMPEIDSAIALHEAFLSSAKGPLLTELQRRAERGANSIEREFRLSQEDIETRRAMLAGAKRNDEQSTYVASIETRTVGNLSGLLCFHPRKDPRSLKVNLQRLVTTLLTWSPPQDDLDATRSMKKAMRDLAPGSNSLNESAVAIRNFYTDANLKELMKLPLIKAQGITSISLNTDGKVHIARQPHWKAA